MKNIKQDEMVLPYEEGTLHVTNFKCGAHGRITPVPKCPKCSPEINDYDDLEERMESNEGKKFVVYATTKNGDGFVQFLGAYDDVDEIRLHTSHFASDLLITIEYMRYEP